MKNKFTSIIILFALIGLNGIVNAQIPTDNLVAWYPFNGNANDLSGNNLNGLVSGAILTSDRVGNTNSAYYFNGTNAFIEVPAVSLLNLTNNFSIGVWVKADLPNVSEYIITKNSSSQCEYQVSLIPTNTADICKQGCSLICYAGLNVTDWNFIVMTFLQPDLKLFINGVLATQATSSAFGTANTSLLIGRANDFTQMFGGIIDDIRIYSDVLTPAEITALYNESFAPTITIQPQSQTVCKNVPQVTFSVVANGNAPLYYQWFKNGTSLPNATQSTYTIYNVQPSDAGGYYCVVTNNLGNVTSNTATLTVIEVQAPAIIGQTIVPPFSQQTYSVVQIAGSTYVFSVTGGNILSTFPNYITVQWGNTGWGQVVCTETNSLGCASNPSVLTVAIGTVGISENDGSKNLQVSPNPSSGFVSISSGKNIETLIVYNNIGGKVIEKDVNALQTSVDLTLFGKGVFYISVKFDDKTINRKVIIQ